MQLTELTVGRTALVVLDPGDDVLPAMSAAVAALGMRSALISTFLGAFRTVTIIATEGEIEIEDAPLGDSVTVRNTEGLGSGTVAPGASGEGVVHLHASVGAKGEAGRAIAGHVLSAIVQYPVEVVITEVLSPELIRLPHSGAFGLATLTWKGAKPAG